MSTPLRIIFMGTPQFAVESCRVINESAHQVVAVVTSTDKPAGRGRKVLSSAVKKYAVSEGIPVLQPKNLKSEEFIDELRSFNADLFVVVAFRMLPKVVWSMPPKGTFNLHASLLPQYRGAAPINWAIINGEKKSGATTFFIDEKIDTGAIIDSVEVEIEENDSAGDLHDRLMILGGKLVLQTVQAISEKNISTFSQKDVEGQDLKPAPKIFAEHRSIDWARSAEDIRNLVRGLCPYPSAIAQLAGPTEQEPRTVKLFELQPTDTQSLKPGELKKSGKTGLLVGTADFDLEIRSIQLPGKKRMGIKDILNGNLIPEGAFFVLASQG